MESGRMEQNIIQNLMETDRNYWKLLRIVQGLGSVNPYSYPCCHAQPCDLWCQRQAMSVTGCQLQKAHIALTSFVEEYKHLYYQRRVDSLHFCRPCLHTLLHLALECACVGPGAYTTQFTMERVIGDLGQDI